MRIETAQEAIQLDAQSRFAIREACSSEIVCTAGMVWITAPRESQDIFLSAGERYRIADNGLVLVEAIDFGQIRVIRNAECNAITRLAANIRRIGNQFASWVRGCFSAEVYAASSRSPAALSARPSCKS